jgi:hypothetical protein
MREYVIEREVPGVGLLTEEQIQELSIRSLQVLKGMGPEIRWLRSYVTDDRIYCVYLAADESSIREHARQLGVPANRVSAVRRIIDPEKYA